MRIVDVELYGGGRESSGDMCRVECSDSARISCTTQNGVKDLHVLEKRLGRGQEEPHMYTIILYTQASYVQEMDAEKYDS